MLYYLLLTVYVLASLLLLLVILMQQGRGGDIASAFSSGGGSQTAFGARQGATVLSKATAVLAVFFIVGALALGIIRQETSGGSVVSGIKAPAAAPKTQTTPAPTTTAPAAPTAPKVNGSTPAQTPAQQPQSQ